MSTSIAKPVPATEEAVATDRRRSVREPFSAVGWLSNEAGNTKSPQQSVRVFNLSLQGAGFTCDKPLEAQAIHWIIVGSGAMRVSSRIRIATCRPDGAGRFDCGGEFF